MGVDLAISTDTPSEMKPNYPSQMIHSKVNADKNSSNIDYSALYYQYLREINLA